MPPWDQRLARLLVRPLARTPVTPNQITALTLVMALAAAALFATGDPVHADWGAGLFALARFMDHFDGELARLTGRTSRFGYYFDYVSGAGAYAALFLAIGIGLRGGALGEWSLVLGIGGAIAALAAMPLNLAIDARRGGGEAVGYPGVAGFELEDGIYLIAPITWVGFLAEFFALCGVGALLYLLWTATRLLRLRGASPRRR